MGFTSQQVADFNRSRAIGFDAQWTPEPNSGCWIWFGYADRRGYGRIFKDGKTKLATHESYERETGGGLLPGTCLLHRCDFPPCINPAHLFIGTRAENVADMVRKGRHRPGGRNRNGGN